MFNIRKFWKWNKWKNNILNNHQVIYRNVLITTVHFIILYSGLDNPFKYIVNHLERNRRYSGLNKKHKNDIIKRLELVNNNQWGIVWGEIKHTLYDKQVIMITGKNHELCDTKVSIDLKSILQLPSTLHYKVSMKCTAVKKIETFDSFDDAVPKFLEE